MRKILVCSTIAVASVLCALSLVLTSAAPQHRAKVGSPNFVCLATWNFGICIGPPTKKA